MFPFYPKLFTAIGLLLVSLSGYAQQSDSLPALPRKDTSKLEKLRQAVKKESFVYLQRYGSDKMGVRQLSTLQELRYTGERSKLYLRKAPDTLEYRHELTEIREELQVLQQGIFVNKGSEYTTRNLAVTSSILNELLVKINSQRVELSRHITIISDFITRIDSLTGDSSIYTFPLDSMAAMQFVAKIVVVGKELGPADSMLRASIGPATQLQTEFDLIAFDVRSRYEEVELLRKTHTASLLDKEFAYLWEKPEKHWTFSQVMDLSLAKEKLALAYYLADYKGRILILLLLIMASWYFLFTLKHRWENEKEEFQASSRGELVLRYPLLSAIVMTVSIFQFIFLQPPFIFSFCLWLITAICLAVIFFRHIAGFWMWFWVIMVSLFILAGLTNMLLQFSRSERWWMLLVSTGGAAYGIYLLKSKRRNELKERNILYFIGFVVFIELAAALLNVFGRLNLSKTMFVSGYSGLVIAILFLWTVRLINEGLGIIAAVYKHPDRKFFYIDFQKVGEQVPTFFYIFLVIGWIILVGRNFYFFQQAATPFMEFLNADRTVGSYTFTINSLFIFIVILAVATILSQIISFFAGEPGDQRRKNAQARKAGAGSWLLLIRIFILTLGIWLAFAAAGIPMDKLTLVLGALGVGIGLGLQGLVSNLVSGLIIAFEKPVNVGDIIEVNGKLGTMKSIGFRSSVVNLVEGACLVVPNGDLLSNHLVNWTMANNRRRLNVVISVPYGTNLKVAKQLLEETLLANDEILRTPEPVVSVKEFGDSGISFDLYFWTGNIKQFLQLRSAVITQVDEAFKQAGIVIPFPQRDLHIITPPGKEMPPTRSE
ncbi:mechanosensitive ion channel family protein [Paraflavitalea pollutisoli]|uniref:mechanosensitive ion channel family protein n=1 Tax=Paraflavitalea pollutisoli TaxID=3034143 RepID=UPI0023EDB519|nr:mechanosensitive ion channel domain-containing protein [Paraflavitalea sp. H1-2-19X]